MLNTSRVDAAQMAELRRWAGRLQKDSESREARAAARAILLLTDEVDRLQSELKDASRPVTPAAAAPPPRDDDFPEEPPPAPPSRELRDWVAETSGGGRAEPTDEDRVNERRRNRQLELRRRKRRGRRRLVLALAILAALVFATFSLGARLSSPNLHAQGPTGNRIGPKGLRHLAFLIRSGKSTVAHAKWKLDGLDVSSRAIVVGDTAVFKGSGLDDGDHVLRVHASGGFPGAGSGHTWRFSIDTTPPEITIPQQVQIESGSPIRISGTIEKDATLLLGRSTIALHDGRFTIDLRSRPPGPLTFRARDPFGNTSRKQVFVSFVPRMPPRPVHAVHVTFYAWATPSLRDPVLRLIDEHRVDAVELDLKDESGLIGWNASIPLGKQAGAVQKIYDLPSAVRLLHKKGVRVIGRIVAFRDPVLASYAWKHGERDEVIQTPDGGQYLGSGYGGFTNFANPVVQRYNVDVAVAAAKAGVDEILYDYVRRPDGPLSTMSFPGLKGSADAAIATFLAKARAALQPYKTFLGASVFGVAATRPEEVAQNIPMMAQHVDYVAPMVYPSHWGPGEYNVSNPNAEPYEIVQRSLKDFNRDVEGTGARVVPWLQDFSLGVDYGPREVRAQINAAHDDGIDEFLLWDPAVTYDGDALDPMSDKPAKRSTPGTTPAGPGTAKRAKANELGQVPVLMYHQFLAKPLGDYDITPAQFRTELERLWRDGFVPITARDLETGHIDIPAGKSPVVLTFDDSTNNQIRFLANGKLDPQSGVGVLMDFARTHPGFTATGTFFILREPFTGSGKPSNDVVRWLSSHGFEIGDHTRDHLPLRTLSDTDVQKELVEGQQIIHSALPGASIVTMALPLGSYPHNTAIAVHGAWGGESYSFQGVYLVGANPAPSPFSSQFDPANIPRIRTAPSASVQFGSSYWLDILERNPGERYVSDGDPNTIAFPSSEQSSLASRYQSEARPY